MKPTVKRAINRFKNGERPWKVWEKRYYVMDDEDSIYPAKYIYALINDINPGTFHTREAVRELTRLGCHIINTDQVLADSENQKFDKVVAQSLNCGSAELKQRLKAARKFPQQKLIKTVRFERNPDVVAYVLLRAKGKCEACQEPAPFKRASDRSPYLEVHHCKTLAHGGEDTVGNAIALCPNCHREKHLGVPKRRLHRKRVVAR